MFSLYEIDEYNEGALVPIGEAYTTLDAAEARVDELSASVIELVIVEE